MVLDTSAILAILQDEPERRKFNEAIEAAETRSLSTASFVECSMILESRYGADSIRDLDLFIAKALVSLAYLWMKNKPTWLVVLFGSTARVATRPASISATAFRTPWRVPSTSPFYSKATTSRRPT